MAEVVLMKMPGGVLAPYDEEATEWMQSIKVGRPVRCRAVKIRSWEFHKKFFALRDFAYDIWVETVPPVVYKGIEVRPNKERFRKDLIILAGYYEATYNIKGEMRLEAKSMSFDAMDQDEFERLFSSCINVILSTILTNRPDLTDAKIRQHVDTVMHFDQGGR
jgi:hypothetical protein